MRLKTRNAGRPHERVMRRPGGQLEPITGDELDGFSARGQTELDRPSLDGDDLVVPMLVRRVALARAIAPAARVETLLAEEPANITCHGYPATQPAS